MEIPHLAKEATGVTKPKSKYSDYTDFHNLLLLYLNVTGALRWSGTEKRK
jgi:hypothetical protein